jgi:hypothetical protein
MFARSSKDPEWSYWGNETEKFGVSAKNNVFIKQIREQQIALAKEIAESKIARGTVDKGNKYGPKRNRQTTLRFVPIEKIPLSPPKKEGNKEVEEDDEEEYKFQ